MRHKIFMCSQLHVFSQSHPILAGVFFFVVHLFIFNWNVGNQSWIEFVGIGFDQAILFDAILGRCYTCNTANRNANINSNAKFVYPICVLRRCNLIIMNLLLCSFICNFVVDFALNINTVRICLSLLLKFQWFPFFPRRRRRHNNHTFCCVSIKLEEKRTNEREKNANLHSSTEMNRKWIHVNGKISSIIRPPVIRYRNYDEEEEEK